MADLMRSSAFAGHRPSRYSRRASASFDDSCIYANSFEACPSLLPLLSIGAHVTLLASGIDASPSKPHLCIASTKCLRYPYSDVVASQHLSNIPIDRCRVHKDCPSSLSAFYGISASHSRLLLVRCSFCRRHHHTATRWHRRSSTRPCTRALWRRRRRKHCRATPSDSQSSRLSVYLLVASSKRAPLRHCRERRC